MTTMRVVVVLGKNSLEGLASSLIAELLAQKAKSSISTTDDPLFGPALLINHARQTSLIVVRPNVHAIEKINRRKVDVVLFNTKQLATDGALNALVKGATNSSLPYEQYELAAVWPQQKTVRVGEKLLDFLL